MAGPMPLLITVVVPLITAYLQRSAAERREQGRPRASELETAQGISVRLSDRLSELHYYFLEAMLVSIDDRGEVTGEPVSCGSAPPAGVPQEASIERRVAEEGERTWATYRGVLVEWKKQRLSVAAAISRYFGARAVEMLDRISGQMDILERQIDAAHFHRRTSPFFVHDTQRSGPRDDERGLFSRLKLEYIDAGNFDFLDTEMYRALPDELKEDYRVKFLPLHRKLGTEILGFSQAMIDALQRREVGVQRRASA